MSYIQHFGRRRNSLVRTLRRMDDIFSSLERVPISPDLFDGAAVTAADVALWLEVVPKISPDSPRADSYVKNYCVVEKIRRAKMAGKWPPVSDSPWQ